MSKDPKALGSFYQHAFDWNVSEYESSGDAAMQYFIARPYGNDDPEQGINGGIGAPPEGYEGHVTFYIQVNDVPVALQRIESLGAKTLMPPQQLPGMTIALFKDPQGNTVGLVDPQM